MRGIIPRVHGASAGLPGEANEELDMPKRTWQPKKHRRMKVHGFLKRSLTRGGRRVLQARRAKGRKRLTVQKNYRVTR